MSVDKYIQEQISQALEESLRPIVRDALEGICLNERQTIWMDKDEVAEWLKVSTSTIDNLRRKEIIKGYKIGIGEKASIRFKKAEIEDAIDKINSNY